MKTKTQDPKFYIEDDRLVGQSGPVPDDEPLFIFRARDHYALDVLQYYRNKIDEAMAGHDKQTEHLAAIDRRISDFSNFRARCAERMKTPDTDLAKLHDGVPEIQTI